MADNRRKRKEGKRVEVNVTLSSTKLSCRKNVEASHEARILTTALY